MSTRRPCSTRSFDAEHETGLGRWVPSGRRGALLFSRHSTPEGRKRQTPPSRPAGAQSAEGNRARRPGRRRLGQKASPSKCHQPEPSLKRKSAYQKKHRAAARVRGGQGKWVRILRSLPGGAAAKLCRSVSHCSLQGKSQARSAPWTGLPPDWSEVLKKSRDPGQEHVQPGSMPRPSVTPQNAKEKKGASGAATWVVIGPAAGLFRGRRTCSCCL
jgi:hypothetical protein